MDYTPPFQMGHPLAFELAQQLATMLPGDLDHVFFSNSGSEAVDTSLKIALAYWQAKGEPERVRFVGRARGYHGVGFGGVGVGIESNRRRRRAASGGPFPHARFAANAFTRGQLARRFAEALEEIVRNRGAHMIAVVIVEPVAGLTGVLVPPSDT